MSKPCAIDFETAAIQPRPLYPPVPAGVAIKLPGKAAKYYAWGHPTGNNCTRLQAVLALRAALQHPGGVVCQNVKFDADVCETHMGLRWPWGATHDTMILAFLADPHSRVLSLKPLAERYLGMPPTEQEAVRDWLFDHGIAKRGAKDWGAHIAQAPGGLVGTYAIGDVDRTIKLWDALYAKIKADGMLPAYQREIALLPILLENERAGVHVDLPLLTADTAKAGSLLLRVDDYVRKYLKTPGLNVDSDRELADAMDRCGKVTDWVLTAKGHRSTAKGALAQACGDKFLLAVLNYRGLLANFHSTFMSPWLNIAQQTGGVIHTNWQSTAQDKGGGTRTGRLSSSPNFQNIPSNDKLDDTEGALAAAGLYNKLKWLPALPHMRQYVIADSAKDVLCGRDFNGQELRVAAHFEDDAMLAAYKADPNTDLHQYGSDKIREYTGLDLPRKKVKIIVFTILYGGGLGTIAERLDTTVENAKKLRDAYFTVFPGIKQLGREMQHRGRNNQPMRTWGGRIYYAEPAKMVDGKLREFSYKLTNYLIQGSSADITKEAMIRYAATRSESRLLLNVHDELVINAPKRVWKREMAALKEAMNGIELDVPMLSEGEVGYRWYGMGDCA